VVRFHLPFIGSSVLVGCADLIFWRPSGDLVERNFRLAARAFGLTPSGLDPLKRKRLRPVGATNREKKPALSWEFPYRAGQFLAWRRTKRIFGFVFLFLTDPYGVGVHAINGWGTKNPRRGIPR